VSRPPKPSSLEAHALPLTQGGDSYAEGFGISILISKNFRHESFEAEETAKELTIKAAKEKAAETKAKAKDEARKMEQTAQKSAAVKQAGTKQKIKKQAATDIKQKTAAAPAKEDAKRCTVSFPGSLVVLVSAALFFAVTMALRSNSSVSTGVEAAEVVTTEPVSSWASGLDDNNVRNGFCAVQEAFETTCSVRLPATSILTLTPESIKPRGPLLLSLTSHACACADRT
jgi:hypothetical protein